MLGDIVAADHVEHHIHPAALPGRLGEVLLAVIDRHIGAEIGDQGAFFRAAGGRQDEAGAGQFRHLDRHHADPAGPALAQEGLTLLQLAALEDIGVHRHHRLGEAGARDKIHRIGERQDAAFVHGHGLGIAPAGQQRADPVADLPARHAIADLGNHAGAFQAHGLRRAGRGRVHALALQQVRPVQAGRANVDQHLLRAGLRPRDRLQCQRRIGGCGDGEHGVGHERLRGWRQCSGRVARRAEIRFHGSR